MVMMAGFLYLLEKKNNLLLKFMINFLVGMIRIELMASSMSTKRSTTELHARLF